MNRVQKSIKAYRWMVQKFGFGKRHVRHSDGKTQREFEDYIQWCDEHGVEPVRFMWARFLYTSERGGNKKVLNPPMLKWEAFVESWEWWYDWAWRFHHEPKLMKELEVSRDEVFRPVKPAKEAIKARYVSQGLAELCRRATEHSGGYHPRSRWCQTCPEAQLCVAQTNDFYGFDVVKVRST